MEAALAAPVRATPLILMPALRCTHAGLWQGPGARCVCAGRVLREAGAALRTPCSPAHGRALAARQAQVLWCVAVSLTLKAEPS